MSDDSYAKLKMPEEFKQLPQVRAFFDKYAAIFSFDGKFGYTNVMEYEINLRPGARPIKHKQRKLPDLHK